MKYYKNMPFGLWVIAIYTILFTIYYHISPIVVWGGDFSIYEPMFTFSTWGLFIWVNIILEVIAIYAATYGFFKAKNWARLYTIALTAFSSFWTLYFLFIERVWPYERYLWFVSYVLVIVYLLLSDVREYFGVKNFWI